MISQTIPVMPFGKHKGTPADQVPPDYARWVLANLEIRSAALKQALEDLVGGPVPFVGTPGGYQKRQENGQPAEDKSTQGQGSARLIAAAEFRTLLKQWYTKVSKQFHPDMGGSNEKQAVVSVCHKAFQEILDQWERNQKPQQP